MGSGLLTDLYELNMAASYLRRDMRGPATFSLFVRRLPRDRGFLVAAGLADCLRFLEDFAFDDGELTYLRESLGYSDEVVAEFRSVRFTGDVWAIPEGTIAFADEPLLEVTAPLPEAQLVETYLLNQVTFQTAIATKASRCIIAAGGRDVVDFAFRRTHGVEAAMAVARTSAMVGFAGTSNVEAARRFGLPAVGTMAHSFIEVFSSEVEAFRAFAQDFPDHTTFLVDTYETEGGVRAAIDVIRDLGPTGRVGVRLDSGDLGAEAVRARTVLDEAGLGQVRIFASGSLDEFAIEALVGAGAPIDAFGVGTKMGVSADAPYVDSVYKVVEYDGRPVMKLSPEKSTAPGRKQVFRHPGVVSDTVGLREEPTPAGARALLQPVMRAGQRVDADEALTKARGRFEEGLADLPADARALRAPTVPAVRPSHALEELTDRVAGELRERRDDAH
ncbi:MAG TPA: nicotinate phosphoribosyltransferase [Actinomycetota bacterium]|nr:nicotinate phosphoribosyltransferase [Actinomycetota bacterium]